MLEVGDVAIEIKGETRPPSNLREVAEKELGPRFAEFIETYGVNFTPKDLCTFLES